MSYLPAIEIESPANTAVDSAVIWLHGLGADGGDFAAIVPQLTLSDSYGIRFTFPHAPSIPVTINGGSIMPAWYDIKDMDVGRKIEEEQLLESAAKVHDLIDRELARGIDSQRIILAGFSQGGAVCYHAALTYPKPLAGLFTLSTWFATAGSIVRDAANDELPIYISHGSQDPVVDESLGRKSRDVLISMNFQPKYNTYPMEHSVCPQQINDLSGWIRELLG